MKDSQHTPVGTVEFVSISKANNERFSTENVIPRPGHKYIKGE